LKPILKQNEIYTGNDLMAGTSFLAHAARILRDGRMTKFKGIAACFAPMAATSSDGPASASISLFRQACAAFGLPSFGSPGFGAIAVGLMSASCLTMVGAGTPVWAADECGVAVAGGTVLCDGDGTPATDANPYAAGIIYGPIDGLTLNVNGAATSVNSTIAVNGAGGLSSGDVVINVANTVDVTTVRRQDFWNQRRPELRESLAHLVDCIMRRVGCDASGAFRAFFV
jgi:hypothetical protein